MNKYDEGDRIELHPALDLWMRGDRFAEVLPYNRCLRKIPKDYVRIRMDKSQKVLHISPNDILRKVG